MMKDTIPPCAADALQRIRQVEIGGVVVGISMLDHILEEVAAMNILDTRELGFELMRRVKVYNYVPPRVEDQYRVAILKEFNIYQKRGR